LRCTALLFVLICPGVVSAQAHGTIVGTVVDDVSGEALSGAVLSVRGADTQVMSDANGIFELAPLTPGDVAVRVELSGYVALVEQVEVLESEVGLFQFRLSPMAALQGLLARARAREDVGATVSHIERGEESVQTALDLLRAQVPGVVVRGRFAAGPGIRIRGSSSLSSNAPAVYVDGVLVADGAGGSAVDVLEDIPAESVERIRVLHGPAAAAQFGDANSGVILVETR
jgi:hypothetical protein